MFRHYLSTALRHFRQHKVTTGINVVCLTLGLMCFMAAWGTVSYFEQRDRYHRNAERTYFMSWKESAARDARVGLGSAFLLAPQLKADFPQLQTTARLVGPETLTVRHEGRGYRSRLAFVDPEFFEVFDITARGVDAATMLRRPRTAIISPSMAIRLFGTEDVIGRTLDLEGRAQVTIAGLVGTIRQPSYFTTEDVSTFIYFDMLVSMDTWISLLESRVPVPGELPIGQWSPDATITLFVLPEDGSLSLEQLTRSLPAFVRRTVPPGPKGLPVLEPRRISEVMQLDTQGMVGSLSGTTILQLLGGLVLIVACVNYANLATAIAGYRMRDVALRKVVGASQRSVMGQHFFEASLLTTTALLFALVCVGILASSFLVGTPTELIASFFGTPEFWIVIATVVVCVSVAAGGYPAFVLARVRPSRILRGAQGREAAGSWIASVLLTVQFAFASMMIIAVLTMLTQYRELRNALWQPDSDPIVMIFNSATRSTVDRQVLRNELQRVPGVLGVTGAVQALWDPGAYPINLAHSTDENATQVLSAINVVDYDFFETVNIRVVAGRDFERTRADDISDLRPGAPMKMDRNVMIDRLLAERLGYGSPQEAIGQTIIRPARQAATAATRSTSTRYHIVGVVDDSLVNPMPMGSKGNLFLLDPYTAAIPIVRVSRFNVPGAMAAIEAVWKRLAPEDPLFRAFADEHFEASFQQFRTIERILMLLAGFALQISTMGLIGMTLHVIRRRTHEIGVRKTLGAGVSHIFVLLIRAFSKPVAVANVVVWPLMFFVAAAYTSLFASNSGVSISPFLISLAVTLAVAWLAVSIQVTRGARVKPAEVLRYE